MKIWAMGKKKISKNKFASIVGFIIFGVQKIMTASLKYYRKAITGGNIFPLGVITLLQPVVAFLFFIYHLI